MAKPEPAQESAPANRSKLPLLLGLALAPVLGGAGFYAVHSGLILAPADASVAAADDLGYGDASKNKAGPLPPVSFVELEPLLVSLGRGSSSKHLRFRAQLEVVPKHAAEVKAVLPRVIDVLNSYLRAVEATELEDPGALMRIRAQMLRRIKIVTGEGRVNDLLVMEFVLN